MKFRLIDNTRNNNCSKKKNLFQEI